MSRRMLVPLSVLFCATLAMALTARAGQVTLSEDAGNGTATFTIDFGHAPDLTTVDAMHRPADGFMIEIARLGDNPYVNPITIVRSDEIQFVNAITVRDAAPADLSDPHSGGWGEIRGTVPFTTEGNDLSFTASLQLLGAPDGQFTYAASTSQFGEDNWITEAESVAVPLPASILGALAILFFGLTISIVRKVIETRARRPHGSAYRF